MGSRRAPSPFSSTSPAATTTSEVILGKYQLGRLLGRGSFAKVYYAKCLSDNTAVAVKVIEKPKIVDAASTEPRIVREVDAMRRLSNHPNILKINEVMATKTKIYLVMELARGGELSVKFSGRRGGRFPEPAARLYFQQLVSALHFCHQHGVTHRDIKPQNLLLDDTGTLKISDFGLSALPENRRDGRMLLHTSCGTPAYAAPEMFRRGAGYDGAKADAWSCGVILFLFLAGYLPFDDSNLATMYKKICGREFQIPEWIPKPAKFVISQLLDPNPITRMSIETLMGHAWFKKSLPAHLKRVPIGESKFAKTTSLNAFDIISMSTGLDLSGLFESTSCSDRERRFTAKASVEIVEERVEQVWGRLGYRVERASKGRTIGLISKGRAVLVAEILMVAPELVMVVVKAVDGCAGVDFEGLHWEEMRVVFENLGHPCTNDVN